jgi:Peptidase family C25/Propeptide_C25
MGLARPRLVAVFACAAGLLLCAGGGEASAAKKPTARSELRTLVRQTGTLPAPAAPAAKRRALTRLARHAARSARGRPCAAVRDLARFRRVLRGIRVKTGSRKLRRAGRRLAALNPASLTASRLLLASRRTRRCGGGLSATTREAPKVRVVASNGRRLRVRVTLPELHFAARQAGGRTWTELAVRTSDAPDRPGTPAIPVVSDFFAVPDGARMRLKTNDVDRVVVDGVDVFPAQPDPVDAVTAPPDFHAPPFASAPFQLNRRAYSRDTAFPAKTVDADSLGRMRDLNLGALQIAAAQYNPASKRLAIVRSVDVTVTFAGGSHRFSDELSSPWEQGQRRLADGLLNGGAISISPDRFFPWRCGEEMMVITNPATLTEANTFASARNAAGIRTRVFQTGAAPGFIGTTPSDIQAFIRSHLNDKACIRPGYVAILGDDELVPTFPGIGGIESDLEYSLANGSDEMPDIALGRITGDTPAQVGTAINKIIAYENSPPGGEWLQRATIAAEFQDDEAPDQNEDRTFILFAEVLRNGLSALGVGADRVYATYPPGAVDPVGYRSGEPLPAELRKPGFAWDGDTADIAEDWNEGRFMMVHRDHGWPDGWDNPRFSSDDVAATTNGAELPVVLSINCSSGAFQDDDTSFVGEALANPNGGAVGAFGDTEVSPTDQNTQIALGFADALIPRVLPSEGPATRQRAGDALMHGKVRLSGIWPPSGPGITGGDGGTRAELYLWHWFGDPTMQMWGGEPVEPPDPSRFDAEFVREIGPPPPDPPPYWVTVSLPAEFNGQVFSILRNGEVIGKGIADGGRANIPATLADGADSPGQLEVAFEADGSPPARIDVRNEPPRRATSITQACSGGSTAKDPVVVEGNLSGAPPGSLVTVTYQHEQGRTETAQGSTDAQGNFKTSLVTNQAGKWTMTARYAGTDEHAPSEGTSCVIDISG